MHRHIIIKIAINLKLDNPNAVVDTEQINNILKQEETKINILINSMMELGINIASKYINILEQIMALKRVLIAAKGKITLKELTLSYLHEVAEPINRAEIKVA